MIRTVINRKYEDKETLGLMVVLLDTDLLFVCKTLELPWKDNEHDISCIPARTYDVIKFNSPNKGMVFLLKNVPGRSGIEIHSGNYKRDTEGCILVGSAFDDINDDGLIDIVDSKVTLERLMKLIPDEFKITIL